MIQTGVRVSELTDAARARHQPRHRAAHIQITGKGRKRRAVTLTRETAAVLRAMAHRTPRPARRSAVPHPPRQRAQPRRRRTARSPSTQPPRRPTARRSTTKRVTPHVLRHTNAMLLKANGVDIATIALWLGHESIKTTDIYQHADPALKEQAIARIAPLGTKPGRYRPTDTLLAFLEAL